MCLQAPAHNPTGSMPCSPPPAPASIGFCPFSPFCDLRGLGVPCNPGKGAAVTLVVPQGQIQSLSPYPGTVTPQGCPQRQGQGLLSPQSPESL